jgi:hypothetical protein
LAVWVFELEGSVVARDFRSTAVQIMGALHVIDNDLRLGLFAQCPIENSILRGRVAQ